MMQETLKKLHDQKLSLEILTEVKKLAKQFYDKYGHKPAFMEVCGSHTMALARTGLKHALENEIQLISGPGCPVCVTDQKDIDAMIALTEDDHRIVCSFGDMIRVPGSKQSLMEAKTEGRDVRVVYSPMDAVKIAQDNPDKEVVFLGIGFETTIPILAAAVQMAEREKISNFSLWTTTKLVEPIIRALLNEGEVKLDGFILPGHVSIVLGAEQYKYIPTEYHKSGVISGFEPVELVRGLYKILTVLLEDQPMIINDHTCIVSEKGNEVAKHLMHHYFEPVDEAWRGMGVVLASGLDFKSEFDAFNAKKKFHIQIGEVRKTKCICGNILKGVASPPDCPLYAQACTPSRPIGPCMVSGEGTCAAYYQYMREV